jgi:hypothetical protein
MRIKSCDDRVLPALGTVNDCNVELGKMENYPGTITVCIGALKEKGMRLDEVSFVNGDITDHDDYVVATGDVVAKLLHRALHGAPCGHPGKKLWQCNLSFIGGSGALPGLCAGVLKHLAVLNSCCHAACGLLKVFRRCFAVVLHNLMWGYFLHGSTHNL